MLGSCPVNSNEISLNTMMLDVYILYIIPDKTAELERRERATIHVSTKDEIIHFSGKYTSRNDLNECVAQGQNPSDVIPQLRRLQSLT